MHPGRARSFSYIVYSGKKGMPWNVTLMEFIVGESGINFWCPGQCLRRKAMKMDI